MPRMQPVESSWVAAIGYDPSASEVYVELLASGTYVYRPVPPSVWRAFAAAESKGSFVNEVLKPEYDFREVPARGYAAGDPPGSPGARSSSRASSTK